jgi:hypothetical protein
MFKYGFKHENVRGNYFSYIAGNKKGKTSG